MKQDQKKPGFTLIELLVVISIIALLLSILMPSLQKVKEQAKAVVCSANVKQLTLGMLMYAEDNDGKGPYYGAWIVSEDQFWIHLIAPYLGESGNFAKNMQDDSVNESLSEKALAVVRCPSTKDRDGETPNVWGGIKWFNGSSKKMWRWGGVQGSYGSMGMNRYCMSRHNRKTTIGFVGGNVERVPITDLWSLKWHKRSKPNDRIVFPKW